MISGMSCQKRIVDFNRLLLVYKQIVRGIDESGFAKLNSDFPKGANVVWNVI